MIQRYVAVSRYPSSSTAPDLLYPARINTQWHHSHCVYFANYTINYVTVVLWFSSTVCSVCFCHFRCLCKNGIRMQSTRQNGKEGGKLESILMSFNVACYICCRTYLLYTAHGGYDYFSLGVSASLLPITHSFISFCFKNYHDNVCELVGVCSVNGTSNAMNRNF